MLSRKLTVRLTRIGLAMYLMIWCMTLTMYGAAGEAPIFENGSDNVSSLYACDLDESFKGAYSSIVLTGSTNTSAVKPGDSYRYSVLIKNNGTAGLDDVYVSDMGSVTPVGELPQGVTFISNQEMLQIQHLDVNQSINLTMEASTRDLDTTDGETGPHLRATGKTEFVNITRQVPTEVNATISVNNTFSVGNLTHTQTKESLGYDEVDFRGHESESMIQIPIQQNLSFPVNTNITVSATGGGDMVIPVDNITFDVSNLMLEFFNISIPVNKPKNFPYAGSGYHEMIQEDVEYESITSNLTVHEGTGTVNYPASGTITITGVNASSFNMTASNVNFTVERNDFPVTVTYNTPENLSIPICPDPEPVTETLTILFAAEEPIIKEQPKDLTLVYGYSPDTLKVTAEAPNDLHEITYQWFQNNQKSNSGGTAINGATGATLEIPAGKNAGTTEYYYCEITSIRKSNNQTTTIATDAATVKVEKAANPATVKEDGVFVDIGGSTADLSSNVVPGAATGAVSYKISGESLGCSLNGSILTSGTSLGNLSVEVTVAEDQNYLALTGKSIPVTIIEKEKQTLQFEQDSVQKTYGDEAFVNPLSGAKTDVTYTVDDGTNTAEVAADGKVTIKGAGSATITAKAEETKTIAGATASYALTVDKAECTFTAPKAIEGLIYSGDAQKLVKEGTASGGTMLYAVNQDPASAPTADQFTKEIPTGINAGSYSVWYMVQGDENHNGTKPEKIPAEIGKAENPATVNESGASIFVGGDTLDLSTCIEHGGATGAVSGTISGEALGCTLDGSILTSGTTLGEISVEVTVAEDQNYLAMPGKILHVTIIEKEKQTLQFEQDSVTKTYGDEAFINPLSGAKTDVTYSITDGDEIAETASDGTVTIKGTGTATITATAEETKSVAGDTTSYTLTVNREECTVTAPEAKNNLTYTGSAQELITAGEAEGGTILYALGTDEAAAPTAGWNTTLPTGTDVGTYTVWYKVEGDENHESKDPVRLGAEIFPVDKEELKKTLGEASDYHSLIADGYPEIAEELKKAIDEAQAVYDEDNVTAEQVKEQVEKLKAALEAAKKTVKEADDKKAADAVSAMIEVLPDPTDITLDHAEAAEAARTAYDALTEEQKALVDPELVKKLEECEKAIAAIQEMGATYYIYAILNRDAEENSEGKVSAIVKRSFADENAFEKFTGVEHEGKALTSEQYEAQPGSVEITLKPAFLRMLSVGEHKVTLMFKDGSVELPFRIIAKERTGGGTGSGSKPKTDPEPTVVPKTGDKANIPLWIGMVVLGVLGICAGAVFIPKRKK